MVDCPRSLAPPVLTAAVPARTTAALAPAEPPGSRRLGGQARRRGEQVAPGEDGAAELVVELLAVRAPGRAQLEPGGQRLVRLAAVPLGDHPGHGAARCAVTGSMQGAAGGEPGPADLAAPRVRPHL